MKSTKFGLLIPAICGLGLAGCFSADSIQNRTRPASTATPMASASPAASSPTVPMTDRSPNQKTGFAANLPAGFTLPNDDVGKRILREYGSMLVAKGVTAPPKLVFQDEADVAAFHGSVSASSETFGGIGVTLQSAALEAFKAAVAKGRTEAISIGPRNADSSKRTYGQTVDNWKSRVDPGLKHWVSKGRLTQAEADRIAGLSPAAQIPEILRLEDQGIFFAQDLSKTIMYSVAPPGTSQHISLLAIDIEQHADARARSIMAEHGWYQTIPSDMPHFTFLGVKESELPGLGLKKVQSGGRDFWIPEL